jgi:hypothetical protein
MTMRRGANACSKWRGRPEHRDICAALLMRRKKLGPCGVGWRFLSALAKSPRRGISVRQKPMVGSRDSSDQVCLAIAELSRYGMAKRGGASYPVSAPHALSSTSCVARGQAEVSQMQYSRGWV